MSDEDFFKRQARHYPIAEIEKWFAAVSPKADCCALAKSFQGQIMRQCYTLLASDVAELDGRRTGLKPTEVGELIKELAALAQRMSEITFTLGEEGTREGVHVTKRDKTMREIYHAIFTPMFGQEIGGSSTTSDRKGFQTRRNATLSVRMRLWGTRIREIAKNRAVTNLPAVRKRASVALAIWIQGMATIYKSAFGRKASVFPSSAPQPFFRFVAAAWDHMRGMPGVAREGSLFNKPLGQSIVQRALQKPAKSRAR